MLWILLLFSLITIILIYWEYRDQNNSDKLNNNNTEITNKNILTRIDKIRETVKTNYDYVSWRLSLLTGIIAALAIIYYLEDRIPTLVEWVIIGGLIFITTYLSSSWIWTHFFQPNGYQTEVQLTQLRDKVHELMGGKLIGNNSVMNYDLYNDEYRYDNIERYY